MTVVWIVLPPDREERHGRGQSFPAHPLLAGLVAPVDDLFWPLDRG